MQDGKLYGSFERGTAQQGRGTSVILYWQERARTLTESHPSPASNDTHSVCLLSLKAFLQHMQHLETVNMTYPIQGWAKESFGSIRWKNFSLHLLHAGKAQLSVWFTEPGQGPSLQPIFSPSRPCVYLIRIRFPTRLDGRDRNEKRLFLQEKRHHRIDFPVTTTHNQ